LYYRQVIAELRKVIWPTRTELITYTSVVLVFVLVIIAYVTALDLAFGRLALWVFG
jgi:preprotein translocase subunit SecE